MLNYNQTKITGTGEYVQLCTSWRGQTVVHLMVIGEGYSEIQIILVYDEFTMMPFRCCTPPAIGILMGSCMDHQPHHWSVTPPATPTTSNVKR